MNRIVGESQSLIRFLSSYIWTMSSDGVKQHATLDTAVCGIWPG
jgi:hypothetical protein